MMHVAEAELGENPSEVELGGFCLDETINLIEMSDIDWDCASHGSFSDVWSNSHALNEKEDYWSKSKEEESKWFYHATCNSYGDEWSKKIYEDEVEDYWSEDEEFIWPYPHPRNSRLTLLCLKGKSDFGSMLFNHG